MRLLWFIGIRALEASARRVANLETLADILQTHMADTDYLVDAKSHLSRARKLLATGERADLLYAALELRLGIESRLRDYLDALEDLTKRKAKGWRIAVLGKELERAFTTGDRVVEIAIMNEAQEPLSTLRYTPVRKRLRRMAGKIGDLLHWPAIGRAKEEWWTKKREWLGEVADELEFACSGELMGPPMLREGTPKMHMRIECHAERMQEINDLWGAVGQLRSIRVRYLDRQPG